MANDQLQAHAAAGTQFDGTAGKGLFNFRDSSGVDVNGVSFVGGTESKSLTIFRVNKYGDVTGKVYERLSFTDQFVELVGYVVGLGPGEMLKIVTSGATSEMLLTVTYHDLKG